MGRAAWRGRRLCGQFAQQRTRARREIFLEDRPITSATRGIEAPRRETFLPVPWAVSDRFRCTGIRSSSLRFVTAVVEGMERGRSDEPRRARAGRDGPTSKGVSQLHTPTATSKTGDRLIGIAGSLLRYT